MSTKPPFDKLTIGLDDTFGSYFANRARQHINDSYMSVPMLKFPEALRLYEHLLWASEADCVIELGCLYGGSTLWFRDHLVLMQKYRKSKRTPHIYAIDKNIDLARSHISKVDPSYEETITLIEGDVRDLDVVASLERILPKEARCLIIEDSAHIYETTFSSLQNFSKFIPKNGFFVVEDGYLDTDLRKQFTPNELQWDGHVFGGVLNAIETWLVTDQGHQFKMRPDWELYGISTMPNGILERVL